MSIKHAEEYRDKKLSRSLIQEIQKNSRKPVRLMEVCGTHTVSIFKYGIRSILPKTISLLSGPGCPVCVTAQGEIDAFIELSRKKDVIITTFGDLMRVPGSNSSLQQERAKGQDIRMVYSAFDALEIAKINPDKEVVFLGVGFETTAPTIAASVLSAQVMNLTNFSVISAHKKVVPALTALLQTKEVNINGFLLPGHVSVIIGAGAYRGFIKNYPIPCVIAGFEPVDILTSIHMLIKQIETGKKDLENAYPRAVTEEGNSKAKSLLNTVFQSGNAIWRGIGPIPDSGLFFQKAYEAFDATRRFQISYQQTPEPKGCACGEVLTGIKTPLDCTLYKKICTPLHPVGPCMVSSEGICAAYDKYHVENNRGSCNDD
ncbi:MAG: hydrogenase formation protein HypD [Desulfobacterium sp.]|nr:hydrogenase formation protein HypD [Desulfobacterium sp.]